MAWTRVESLRIVWKLGFVVFFCPGWACEAFQWQCDLLGCTKPAQEPLVVHGYAWITLSTGFNLAVQLGQTHALRTRLSLPLTGVDGSYLAFLVVFPRPFHVVRNGNTCWW